MQLRLPDPCVVVLVGPSGSGKTTWALDNFPTSAVISSDALRGLVGEGEHDQRASKDAFEILDLVLDKRLRRRLTTVIDTLGLDDETRAGFLDAARRHGLPCHAVGFDTDPKLCRDRNARRERPVPAKILAGQIRRWTDVRDRLAEEGFDGVHEPGTVVLVPPSHLDAPDHAIRQEESPVTLEFGLQISSFTFPGGTDEIGPRLAEIAGAAEEAGFTSLWVMDHFRQIPQMGPEWNDMLDSYTTLGFLAAATESIRLGVLVTGITYRNPAHLGKIVATVDVLSRGRTVCGLGIGWFEAEAKAYGWDFPPVKQRYALLEDTLELLPLLWGPGSPAFEGRVVSVPEAMCYPRPIQEHIPILVGGSGEKKTLRLVAQHADMCNLFGDPATIARKVEVLHRHCRDLDRDPSEIAVTNLTSALVGSDHEDVARRVEVLTADPRTRGNPAWWGAGPVEDQIGRYRAYADAGVDVAIVGLPDLEDGDAVRRFAPVVEAFRR